MQSKSNPRLHRVVCIVNPREYTELSLRRRRRRLRRRQVEKFAHGWVLFTACRLAE